MKNATTYINGTRKQPLKKMRLTSIWEIVTDLLLSDLFADDTNVTFTGLKVGGGWGGVVATSQDQKPQFR